MDHVDRFLGSLVERGAEQNLLVNPLSSSYTTGRPNWLRKRSTRIKSGRHNGVNFVPDLEPSEVPLGKSPAPVGKGVQT